MVLNSKRAAERAERGLPEPPTCAGHKKDGTPCKKNPIKGATVCRVHGGAAPQVRKRAQERLQAAADILMAQLLKIASSAESEAVRLSAVNSALDRAGYSAASMVKLAVVAPWEALLGTIVDDDIFIDAPAGPRGRRALPAHSSGGIPAEQDWDQEEDNRTAVAYVDGDDDAPSFNTPDTIRGEVVRDYASNPTKEQRAAIQRTERRAQRAMVGKADSDARAEFSERDSTPSTDSTRPPKYVRDAMEADGKDWRAGEGGGSRRADMGP